MKFIELLEKIGEDYPHIIVKTTSSSLVEECSYLDGKLNSINGEDEVKDWGEFINDKNEICLWVIKQ